MRLFLVSLSFILFVFIVKAQQMKPFTPGNVLVLSQNIPGGFAPVFIKEYTPSGKLVQVANLGTLQSPNNPCFLPNPNTGSTEFGYLSKSADGQYVSFAAYGQANASGKRVGALIKYDGTINTQTVFNNSDNPIFYPKSVVTADGKGLWLSTSHLSSDSNYILYQPVNATSNPIQIIETPDKGLGFRQLNISSFDNNLYLTRGNSSFHAFNGLPTTTVSRTTKYPPINTKIAAAFSKGFCFVQPLSGGGEVMYTASVAASVAQGTITEGTNILTLSVANPNFAEGNVISGPGITAGSKITAANGNVITISTTATATQTALNFYSAPSNSYGIYKFYRSTPKNAWTAAGGFGSNGDNYLTVTALANTNGTFTLYATKYTNAGTSIKYTNLTKDGTPQVVKITDTSFYNASMAAKEQVIAALETNRDVFRGVALVPTATNNAAIYYYKGSGALDVVTSWGNNYDGTGLSPANFSTDNQIFIITNADVVDKINGKTWAISGKNVALYIGDGHRKVQLNTSNKVITINGEKISANQVYFNSKLN